MGNNQSDQPKQSRTVDGRQHQSAKQQQQQHQQQQQQQATSQEYEDYGEGTSVDAVRQKEDVREPTTDVISGLTGAGLMSGLPAADVMLGLPGEKGKPTQEPKNEEHSSDHDEMQKRNTDDHGTNEKMLADRVCEDSVEKQTDTRSGKHDQPDYTSSQHVPAGTKSSRYLSNRSKSQQTSNKTDTLKSSSSVYYRPQKRRDGTDEITITSSLDSRVKQSLKLSIPKSEDSAVAADKKASKLGPLIDLSELPPIQTKISGLDPSGKFKRRLTFDIDDNRIKYLPEEHNLDNAASRPCITVYSNVVFLPDKSKGASPKRYGPKRLGTAHSKVMENIEESDSDSFEYQMNIPVEINIQTVETDDCCSQHSSVICEKDNFISKESIPSESGEYAEQPREVFNFVDDHFALETGSIACGVLAEFGVDIDDEAGSGGPVQHVDGGPSEAVGDTHRSVNDTQYCDNAQSAVKEKQNKPEDIPMIERSQNSAQVQNNIEAANRNADNVSGPVDNTTDQGFFCSDGSSEHSESGTVESKERNCLSLQDGLYDTGQSSDTESEKGNSDLGKACSLSAVNPALGISRFCERYCREVDYSKFESMQGQFVQHLKSSKTDIAIDNRFTLAFNFPCCRGFKSAEVTEQNDTVCMSTDADFMTAHISVNLGDSLRTVGSIDSHDFIMNDFDSCSDDDESITEKYIVEDMNDNDSAKKSIETQDRVDDELGNSPTGIPYVEEASSEKYIVDAVDMKNVVDGDGSFENQNVDDTVETINADMYGEINEQCFKTDNCSKNDFDEIENVNDPGSDQLHKNCCNDDDTDDIDDEGKDGDDNDEDFDVENVTSSVLDTASNMLNMGVETGSHLLNTAGLVSEQDVSNETEIKSKIQTDDVDAQGEKFGKCVDMENDTSGEKQNIQHNISEESTIVSSKAVNGMEQSDHADTIKGITENDKSKIEIQDTEPACVKIKTSDTENHDNSLDMDISSESNIDGTRQDCAVSIVGTEATCEGMESAQTEHNNTLDGSYPGEQKPELRNGNSNSDLSNVVVKPSSALKETHNVAAGGDKISVYAQGNCKESLENRKAAGNTDSMGTIGTVRVSREAIENLGTVLRRKETTVLTDNRIWSHFNRTDMEDAHDDNDNEETEGQESGSNTEQTASNVDSDSKRSEKSKFRRKHDERGYLQESERKDTGIERTKSGVLDRLRQKKDPQSRQRNERLLFPSLAHSLVDPLSGLDLTLPSDEFLRQLRNRHERNMGFVLKENKNLKRTENPDPASHDDNTSEDRRSSVSSSVSSIVSNDSPEPEFSGLEFDVEDEEQSSERQRAFLRRMFGEEDQSDKEKEDEEKTSMNGMMIEDDIWRQAIDEETYKCFKNPGPENCRCTVLLVDISGSMQGEPWQQLHTAITEFIQGLEEMREKHKVEERVAMVTFGHETKMAVTPTSNYQEILHTFEGLTANGMSPMGPGLMMALFPQYDEAHGSFCHFHLDSHIRGRVILLTDGHPTPRRLLAEKDLPTLEEHTEGDVEFVHEIKDLPLKNTFQIICVPIGSGVKMDLLQTVADTHEGKVVASTEMKWLARSTHNHYMAAPIMKQMVSMKRDKLDVHMFRSLVLMLYPDIPPADITEMVEFVELENKRLHAGKSGVETWVVEDSSDDDESESEYTLHWEQDAHLERDKLPPLGTRVARGPDMKVERITGVDNGTITGHSSKHKGKLFVHWDSGRKMKCRYGYDNHYDVVLDDTPVKCRIEDPVKIGCKVRRGPDWCYCDQDGGSDQLGAVYDVSPEGVVLVRWPNGCHGNYRYNVNNMYDVLISDPADPYGALMFTADMNKRNVTKTRQNIGASPYRNHRLNIDLSKSMFGLGIPSPGDTNLNRTPVKV